MDIESLSDALLDLKQQEDDSFLADVPYDEFWNQIKLVGYTMKLRPEHMRVISDTININYDEDIIAPKFNEKKALLCDDDFGFEHGLHDPQKMLLTGFLYCQFHDEEVHLENLWHLINPNFKTRVSLRILRTIIEDLLYISIDQRLKMIMK